MAATQLGELFMFPVDERPSESGVTLTTSWQEIDFSDDVPAGATAIMLAVELKNNDGRHIVSVAEDNTSQTPGAAFHSGFMEQAATYGGYNRSIRHLTVLAPGGKFYMAEYDTSAWETVDATGQIRVLGYYMPVAQPQPLLPGGITVTWTKLNEYNSSYWESDLYYGKDGDVVYLQGKMRAKDINTRPAGDVMGLLPSGYRAKGLLQLPGNKTYYQAGPYSPCTFVLAELGSVSVAEEGLYMHQYCINASFLCA